MNIDNLTDAYRDGREGTGKSSSQATTHRNTN